MRHLKIGFIACISLFLHINTTAQWTQQPSDPNNNYNAVFFIDKYTGWIAGWDDSNGFVLHTQDGGEHWNRTDIEGTEVLKSIHFINPNTGWVVGSNGVILKTTDGGLTWQQQVSGTDKYLYDVHFLDENKGWICYGYYIGEPSDWNYFGLILSTIDGGNTWSIQKEVEGYQFKRIYFVNQTIGWATGVDFSHQQNRVVYRTTNGGSTWESVELNTIIWRNFNDIHFIDETTGWIVGESGLVLKTTDGGESWVTQSEFKGYNLYTCYALNQQKIYAAGRHGTIIYSDDGGESWTEQESGTNDFLYSIYFTDENTGWVVGSDSVLLKYGDGSTAIENITKQKPGFGLKQIYPNPAEEFIVLSLSSDFDADLSIEWLNVQGIQVKAKEEFRLFPGENVIEYNNIDLTSGLYFLKLSIKNMQQLIPVLVQ